MQETPAQSDYTAAHSLPHANTPCDVLSEPPTTLRFSDASIHTHDPRHQLALMVQTRKQCRSGGLIKRDYDELDLIGARLGITIENTRAIIAMVDGLPEGAPILDLLTRQLLTIPVEPGLINEQRKTRVQPRALIALSIWSLSIIIAMMML